jgi:uncharacterized protein YecE (DUF72 family)
MKSGKGIFRIGTSNIVVPGNKKSYPKAYQGKSRLNYYSSFFNSLEINSTFYKVPLPATFEKWGNDVPEHFRFTVKLWKEITHVKGLKTNLALIDDFLRAADKLGEKKACLLIQFPGTITIEYYSQVENILERIRKNDRSKKWNIAVEFRHASWYIRETFELLDQYSGSIVLHDIAKGRNSEFLTRSDFVFVRFHGPAGDYRGSYSKEQLRKHAAKIRSWLKQGKDVYAYFNNTIGDAFQNARDLQLMIKKL